MNKFSFDPSESLAVARLVWGLIFSDGEVDRRESDFFEQMLQSMNLTSEKFEFSLSEPIEHSYEVVKAMSAEKRRECSQLLRLAVSSDDVVLLSELTHLNEILEKTAMFRSDVNDMNKTGEGFS